jgi:hypothetical protein
VHRRSEDRRSARPKLLLADLPQLGRSEASLGISRSSGNKLRFAYSCCSSSSTNSVLRHAACAGVDLTQRENSPLHRFVGSQAMVFYDAEIAMILAVFFAVDAAQKHAKRALPDPAPRENTWSSTLPSFQIPMMTTQHLSTRMIAKKTEKCRQLRRLC